MPQSDDGGSDFGLYRPQSLQSVAGSNDPNNGENSSQGKRNVVNRIPVECQIGYPAHAYWIVPVRLLVSWLIGGLWAGLCRACFWSRVLCCSGVFLCLLASGIAALGIYREQKKEQESYTLDEMTRHGVAEQLYARRRACPSAGQISVRTFRELGHENRGRAPCTTPR